ncbi:interleukin-3 receptor subunit alpha isoform X2 [Meriones unguiculatus]|uniref:interleukin-3 receptor subunit alpha isoform X2 n=1 Tax=Meriones unguiculatus TaxID=10047 RepID=UPI00293E9223|nr:interleukin-3 receptor subunit alpha isoform X2 [Meriones unguiculatus]
MLPLLLSSRACHLWKRPGGGRSDRGTRKSGTRARGPVSRPPMSSCVPPPTMATVLWLLLALTGSLMSSDPGPAPLATPFRNLHLDPERLLLSWEQVTPTPQPACRKWRRGDREEAATVVFAEVGRPRCSFRSLSHCHMTEFSVSLPSNHSVARATLLFPEADGDRAAAATPPRCQVDLATGMTCRWGPGPRAPRDVQYRMFWRDAAQGRNRDRECPRYDVMEGGTRLGCVLENVTVLPSYITVTVTGSAGGGTEVPCSDSSVDLQLVEVVAPPNVSATCNGSVSAFVHWEVQSVFHRNFEFQLEMRRNSQLEPEIETTEERHFWVVNPGTLSVRVRARPVAAEEFGMWSDVQHLAPPCPRHPVDCDPRRNGLTRMVVSLAAVGAGLTGLGATLLLCRRRGLSRKLFPPIPHVKDPTVAEGEVVDSVTWWARPEEEECEVTSVTEAGPRLSIISRS